LPADDVIDYVVGVGMPQLVSRMGAKYKRIYSCMSNESEILTARANELQL